MNWKKKRKLNKRPYKQVASPGPEGLYKKLLGSKYRTYPYQVGDLHEGMATVELVFFSYWKPLYLVDHRSKRAWKFMDTSCSLLTITGDDIDWDSLKGLPEAVIMRAELLKGQFPTVIRRFHGGVAMVTWQLNPDGRYYMDEDGYGMTDDEKIELVGKIDREGKVVEKFRYDPYRCG